MDKIGHTNKGLTFGKTFGSKLYEIVDLRDFKGEIYSFMFEGLQNYICLPVY